MPRGRGRPTTRYPDGRIAFAWDHAATASAADEREALAAANGSDTRA